jgi:hypothetical protein
MKSPSSSKKLFEMQKQLGIRMRAKRAAMLAENNINLPSKDEDDEDELEEIEEVDEDSMDTTDESNDANSEIISNVDKENVRKVFFQMKIIFFFLRRIYKLMKRQINL